MRANSKELVGWKLKRLRGKRTQRDVAKAVGVSISAISSYEAGEKVPRDNVKCALADFYGTSVEQIFFDQNIDSESNK